jgi:hypothetical protein
MSSNRMAVVALFVLAGTAVAEKRWVPPPPAPKRPAALAPVRDRAEPPLKVEVAFPGAPAQPVGAVSSARGATLRLNTPGEYHGGAALTFKSAPPMRFTLRLTRMSGYDLESLAVSSGSLSLAVGQVSASPTTRYFDAAGRAQDGPERAAYAVLARRWDGDEVDVAVRRAPGAALGKVLNVSWRSDLGHGRFLGAP